MEALGPQAFYHLRDDRTNRLTTSRTYHHLRVRLIASPATAHSFGGQVQLLVAANMLACWCRNIEFGFADASLVKSLQIEGCETLHQRIAAEVYQADPFGRFIFNIERSRDTQYTLKVGRDHFADEPVDFTIDSDGWHVWAGRGHHLSNNSHPQENPIGPAFAACIGVADAFKVATGLPEESRTKRIAISLFHLAFIPVAGAVRQIPMPGVVALGRTQIIGIGSVGSAVIYLLRMLPLDASIQLIDHDRVEAVNLNRSPLFGFADVNMPKVEVAARHLQSLVQTEIYQGRYDEFVNQFGRKPGDVDIVLPLANEFGVRSFIENNFPPIQIYGTTTGDWGINFHRHIPFVDDCSLCRFPADQQQAKFLCSEAQIETESEKQVDAALPFLSMGAAALTVADLMRLQLAGYPFTPNFAYMDFKGNFEFLGAHSKRNRAMCTCAGRSSTIHRRYISATRFATASRSNNNIAGKP